MMFELASALLMPPLPCNTIGDRWGKSAAFVSNCSSQASLRHQALCGPGSDGASDLEYD